MLLSRARHAVLTVGLLVLQVVMAAPASGDETTRPGEPPPTRAVPTVRHAFLDTTNAVLTGVETAGLIVDASSTRRVLDTYPTLAVEGDPLARPFVALGWSGQIIGGLLFVGAELLGRYALHKGERHRLERLLPLVIAGLEFGVTAHNVQSLHALDREVAAGRLP